MLSKFLMNEKIQSTFEFFSGIALKFPDLIKLDITHCHASKNEQAKTFLTV